MLLSDMCDAVAKPPNSVSHQKRAGWLNDLVMQAAGSI